jgi:cyanoexosortase B-associated protein
VSSTPASNPADKKITQLIVVAALALFVAISALPHYVGDWPWATPMKLPAATRTALQAIPNKGITLPGWQTEDQSPTKLGGKTWSVQQLAPAKDEEAIFLLLRPQIYEADQPEVEWLDIKGSQKWSTDSHQTLTFEAPLSPASNPASAASASPTASATKTIQRPETVRVHSDFFRAWSQSQTYAVLQWYAWPTGGSDSPAKWFWADQRSQWQHRARTPWVAVSLWLPIQPLSDIAPQKERATDLGKALQQAIDQQVFMAQAAPAVPAKPRQ